MSTRVAVISEGMIDLILLRPLLKHIAQRNASYRWPVESDDIAEQIPIRKTGHGGVLKKVEALLRAYDQMPQQYDLFVIVLDRKTKPVQNEIRRLMRGRERFVLGIAIEEIEAWWLGDRTSTLAWCGFTETPPADCRYTRPGYAAEKDDNPKRTLDELTRRSDRFERYYGDGSPELAQDFVEGHWHQEVRLDEIATQCPRGFGAFQRDVGNAFRAAKARENRGDFRW